MPPECRPRPWGGRESPATPEGVWRETLASQVLLCQRLAPRESSLPPKCQRCGGRPHRPGADPSSAIGPGLSTEQIEVIGDGKQEADEYFSLDLFGNSSNALFTKQRGLGTILNDD